MQKYFKIVIDLFDEGAGAAQSAGSSNGGSGNNTGSAEISDDVRADITKKGRQLGLSDDLMKSYQEAYDSKHGETEDIKSEEDEEEQKAESVEEEFKSFIKGKYKEPFNNYVKSMISDRMHTRDTEIAQLKSKAQATDKILNILSLKYPDVDSKNLDDLLKAVENDEDVWNQKALDGGITADEAKNQYTEQLKQDAMQQELEQLRKEKSAGELDRRLSALAEITAEKYPDFNLHQEFSNPKFCSALDFIAQQNEAKNKETGKNDEIFDLTYAYELAHADELRDSAVSKASKAAISAVTKNIAANRSRPGENANRHSAPVPQKSVSDMTDDEFDVLLEKIKNGSAHIPR